MVQRLLTHLSYANVMATVAVFIALGGSAYAALRVTGKNVPNNALTGADIKNLTGKDVRNNSLTGKDVKNLTSADVTNGRLLAEDFASGQLPRGETGPAGRDGAPGATNAVVRTIQACPSLPVNVHCSIGNLQCQPGERATGGGAGFADFSGNEIVNVSHPLEADGTNPETGDIPTGWTAGIKYTSGGPRSAFGYVVCVSP